MSDGLPPSKQPDMISGRNFMSTYFLTPPGGWDGALVVDGPAVPVEITPAAPERRKMVLDWYYRNTLR